MLSFERLIREHRTIAQLSAELQRTLAVGAEAPVVHDAMSTLSNVLIAHLATEDADIYPRLMVSRDAGAAHAARQAIAQFQTLASDWMAHIDHWQVDAIADRRAAFDAATTAILDRLDARIRQENELLYPMALNAAHLPLRDAAA